MNRREYLAAVNTGVVATAGCVGGNTGGGEVVQETFEGEGASLQEFDIEREGAVFFKAEAAERLDVTVVPDDDDRAASFTVESELERMKVHRELEPGDYALEVESEGAWSISLEEHPPVNDADSPDFPLSVQSETRDVFGPFHFEGFMSLSTYSTVLSGISFIDGSGNRGDLVEHSQMEAGEEINHGSVNLEGPYWLAVVMNLSLHNDGPIEFEATFEEAE